MDSPNNNNNSNFDDQDEEEVQLPGFRFHPTDEELVGFYLRRKVDMKPLSIELIKTIDIYKYDPWDLPKASCTSGDKEWYFFSKRGRKYKNSIRPNRVTGSGFWKATGIDKPVNSHVGENNDNNNNDNNKPILSWNNQKNDDHCIGLKKTLVYYRGSAGKGTKTDWMMHEFRLPAIRNDNKSSPMTDSSILQEAEIWTLCRIFKRTASYRKYTPDFKELSSKRTLPNMDTNMSYNKRNCLEFNGTIEDHNYIDFTAPTIFHDQEKKPAISNNQIVVNDNENNNIGKFHHGGGRGAMNQVLHVTQLNSMATHNNSNINNDNKNNNNNYVDSPCNNNSNNNNAYNVMDYYSSLSSSLMADEIDQEFGYASWDELRAVVEYALDPALT